MHPRIKIAEEAVSILLLKTAPGLESDVHEKMTTALPHRDAQVLLGFGDYDLLAITRGVGGPLSHSNTGAIPNILGAREVVCFGIEQAGAEGGKADLIETLARRQVFSLTFVRVPGFFTLRDNVQPERKFLDWWWKWSAEHDSAGDQFLLGTLGGPEFVIVHANDSIESVHKWIESGPTVDESVAKSFSIIAVNMPVHDSSRQDPGLGACYRGLSMELKVSCQPRHAEILANRLVDLAGELSPSPSVPIEIKKRALVTGMEDFVFSLDGHDRLNLVDLVKLVLRFRNECRQLLLGTSVGFQHDIAHDAADENPENTVGDAVKALQSRVVDPPRLDLTYEQSRKIALLPDVGPVAVRALYQFGNILQNPLLTNDLIDLFLYFQSFKKQALNTDSDDVKGLNELADRLTPAHHGVDQRTIGANEGVNPVESNVRHLLGGTQKIMQAAESIPLSVFQQFNDSLWPGFIIFGTYQEFKNHDYMALNLPPSCMWEPSRWVWLLHESVHGLLCNDQNVFSRESGVFADFNDNLRHRVSGLSYTMSMESLEFLGLEVFTDLIELNYGPLWDPDLVLKSRWQYYSSIFDLESLSVTRAYSLVLRSMFALICLKNNGVARGESLAMPPDLEPYDRSWREMYESWKDIAPSMETMHKQIKIAPLQVLMKLMWPLQDLASSFMPFDSESLAERKNWWNGEANEQIKRIEAGEPIEKDDVRYPELFVWKLVEFSRKHDGMTIPQRTAAMLGLHDWYRQTWTARRDKAIDALKKKS